MTSFGSCIEVKELYWFDPAADKQLPPTYTSSGALTDVVEDGNELRKSPEQPSRSENVNVVGDVEPPPNVGYQIKLCIYFPLLVPTNCPFEYTSKLGIIANGGMVIALPIAMLIGSREI